MLVNSTKSDTGVSAGDLCSMVTIVNVYLRGTKRLDSKSYYRHKVQ
jgi:hypothetical protein